MNAADILSEAKARGVVLVAHGATLRIGARRGALTPAFHARVLALKTELLALLRHEEEAARATREQAERAWRMDYANHLARARGYPDEIIRVAIGLLARQPHGRPFRIDKEAITIEMGYGIEVRVHRLPQPWAASLRDGDAG